MKRHKRACSWVEGASMSGGGHKVAELEARCCPLTGELAEFAVFTNVGNALLFVDEE